MKHRLFISIDLPPDSIEEIVSLQQQLGKFSLPIDWEKPHKIHLTLNFLGKVTHEDLAEAKKIITNVSKGFSPFELQPFFLETLYRRHEPTLLYLSVAADTRNLKELQTALSDSLSPISPQPRKYLPHITIGRLKRADPTTTKSFIDKISEIEIPPLSLFNVDHITLYESFLSRDSSTYQKVSEFMLE